jgi:hypothetical protein
MSGPRRMIRVNLTTRVEVRISSPPLELRDFRVVVVVTVVGTAELLLEVGEVETRAELLPLLCDECWSLTTEETMELTRAIELPLRGVVTFWLGFGALLVDCFCASVVRIGGMVLFGAMRGLNFGLRRMEDAVGPRLGLDLL